MRDFIQFLGRKKLGAIASLVALALGIALAVDMVPGIFLRSAVLLNDVLICLLLVGALELLFSLWLGIVGWLIVMMLDLALMLLGLSRRY